MPRISRSSIINIVKYALLILVLFYVSRFIIKSVRDIDRIDFHFRLPFLLLAVVFHFLYMAAKATIWHYITYVNKIHLAFRDSVAIWFLSLLGKYIPGKVFLLGARVFHYHKAKKSNSLVVYSFFIEYVLTIVASILLFVVSFSFIPHTSFHSYRLIGFLLAAIMLGMLHPAILNLMIAFVNKILKKQIPALKSITYLNILIITVFYLLAWCLLGLGFFFLVMSFHPMPISRYLYVTGSFALATIIGILSLFAPSGIGVREAVIIATLSQIMPTGVASIISVLARVWATSSELFWILVTNLINRFVIPKKQDIQDLIQDPAVNSEI